MPAAYRRATPVDNPPTASRASSPTPAPPPSPEGIGTPPHPRGGPPAARWLGAVVLACCAFASMPNAVVAQATSGLAIFDGANLALGERLIREHRCTQCHAERFGGDGSAVYRPQGRINTPGFLRGMVEQCNTELNMGLFPEEVTAVAAVLQRDHYRFR